MCRFKPFLILTQWYQLKNVKVALSRRRLEDFYFSKINMPIHYHEQKIEISCLKEQLTYSNLLLRIVICNIYFGELKIFQYLLTYSWVPNKRVYLIIILALYPPYSISIFALFSPYSISKLSIQLFSSPYSFFRPTCVRNLNELSTLLVYLALLV